MLDFTPTFEAWPKRSAIPALGSAAGYSLGISAAATLLAMALGLPAAGPSPRRPHPTGADLVVVGFLIVRLLPPIALVIPFYLMAAALGLLDTALVLILVNATLVFPLVVVLLRQAFADVPPELEEAAGIDGRPLAHPGRHRAAAGRASHGRHRADRVRLRLERASCSLPACPPCTSPRCRSSPSAAGPVGVRQQCRWACSSA